jgi:cytochrome c553
MQVRLHFGFRKGPRMKREPDRATDPKERKNSCTTAAAGIALVLLVVCTSAVADNDTTSPDAAIRAAEAWAFSELQSSDPSSPHAQLPEPGPHQVMHLPGSTRSYTWGELDSNFVAPDWFPQDHPPAPRVVLYGRKPAWASGACHYANGAGDTSSAALAGLPKAYIVEQIKAFRDGQRRPPDPSMTEEARHLDDTDLQRAAEYFSRLKLTPLRRVIETATVSSTHWEWFVLAPDKDGAREPIGERIIEVSNNQKLCDWGDERTGFVAYVPPGSIVRGALIASKGKASIAACEACHGAKLEGQTMSGIGIAPPLAGRSPTYIVKELILFHEGKRTESTSAPMRAEASQLTVPEMIDVAAYAASRKP